MTTSNYHLKLKWEVAQHLYWEIVRWNEVIQEKYNLGIIITQMEQVCLIIYQQETSLKLLSLKETKVVLLSRFQMLQITTNMDPSQYMVSTPDKICSKK